MLRFPAFALMVFVAGQHAHAAPRASITPTLPSPDDPAHADDCGGFPSDELDFAVSNNGKQVYKETICSSYGEASTRIVTDKLKHVFVLLELADGRGTNVSTKDLELYRLEHSDLLEVLETPLS